MVPQEDCSTCLFLAFSSNKLTTPKSDILTPLRGSFLSINSTFSGYIYIYIYITLKCSKEKKSTKNSNNKNKKRNKFNISHFLPLNHDEQHQY